MHSVRTLVAVGSVLATVTAILLAGCQQPPLPAAGPLTPPDVTQPREPAGPFEGIYAWAEPDEAPLGVGRLYPADSPPLGKPAAWVSQIALPLFETPDSVPWGWINRGWIQYDGLTLPFELSGMVETEYEDLSFIVTESRPDGWLRVRFGAPADPHAGLAWLHLDHLRLGSVGLIWEPWPVRFLSNEISPLHMRGAGPWPLLAAPAEAADIIGEIAADHAATPVEFAGEWLRVRIRQPNDHCTSEPLDVTVLEGWVRWWEPGRGPLVWYSTRGC